MALLSTVTVDAAAASAPRRMWLSFWSLGETAGGDEMVGVVVVVLNREGEREWWSGFGERGAETNEKKKGRQEDDLLKVCFL